MAGGPRDLRQRHRRDHGRAPGPRRPRCSSRSPTTGADRPASSPPPWVEQMGLTPATVALARHGRGERAAGGGGRRGAVRRRGRLRGCTSSAATRRTTRRASSRSSCSPAAPTPRATSPQRSWHSPTRGRTSRRSPPWAPRREPARVAAAYAVVVGFVGAVLGAAVGFIPGIAVSIPLTVEPGWGGMGHRPVPRHPVADDPGPGGMLPLLTAAVVALCTRSRLPLVARLD